MWLFLATFMIHDFEEIIVVESWMKKNYPKIRNVVPRPLANRLKDMSTIKSSQFTVAVLLEFIIFIPITYLAVEHQNYLLFVGFNAILLLHVFMHLGQSIYLKMYTPGVITGIVITLPYTIYLFYRMVQENLLTLKQIILYAPSGLLLLPIILVGHRIGKIVIRD